MNKPYVCVATRLHLRGRRMLPEFLRASAQAARVARSTPGNVRARRLGLPPLLTFFTLSVWESEEAMRAFVLTPEHRAAMAHMDAWASDGAFVHFSSTKSRVGWRTARRHLRAHSAIQHTPST